MFFFISLRRWLVVAVVVVSSPQKQEYNLVSFLLFSHLSHMYHPLYRVTPCPPSSRLPSGLFSTCQTHTERKPRLNNSISIYSCSFIIFSQSATFQRLVQAGGGGGKMSVNKRESGWKARGCWGCCEGLVVVVSSMDSVRGAVEKLCGFS